MILDTLAASLADTTLAEAMRTGRWSYAAASTAHVLGLALLVGAVATLDFRLLGCWSETPVATLARVLAPVAAAGLMLAICAGVFLFLAAPAEYLGHPLFGLKIVLIGAGTGHAILVHAGAGLEGSPARLRRIGAISLSIWLAVLICGRMLAFVD